MFVCFLYQIAIFACRDDSTVQSTRVDPCFGGHVGHTRGIFTFHHPRCLSFSISFIACDQRPHHWDSVREMEEANSRTIKSSTALISFIGYSSGRNVDKVLYIVTISTCTVSCPTRTSVLRATHICCWSRIVREVVRLAKNLQVIRYLPAFHASTKISSYPMFPDLMSANRTFPVCLNVTHLIVPFIEARAKHEQMEFGSVFILKKSYKTQHAVSTHC